MTSLYSQPFGEKSGSKDGNWELYREALAEMARVCHPVRGRAVLLTKDKRPMLEVSGGCRSIMMMM